MTEIGSFRGQPDGLIISHLPYGPTAYFALLNVLTRHDIGVRINTTSSTHHTHTLIFFKGCYFSLVGGVFLFIFFLFQILNSQSHFVFFFVGLGDNAFASSSFDFS
jgi:U3 small nucleolar ribonucleoprotein protein IMP4